MEATDDPRASSATGKGDTADHPSPNTSDREEYSGGEDEVLPETTPRVVKNTSVTATPPQNPPSPNILPTPATTKVITKLSERGQLKASTGRERSKKPRQEEEEITAEEMASDGEEGDEEYFLSRRPPPKLLNKTKKKKELPSIWQTQEMRFLKHNSLSVLCLAIVLYLVFFMPPKAQPTLSDNGNNGKPHHTLIPGAADILSPMPPKDRAVLDELGGDLESYTINRLKRNADLRFYVENSILAPRIQPLALVSNVTDLVRGYARALAMCQTLSSSIGLTGAMQSTPGAEERKLDDLYLSSSSVYSPFFCVNVPISAIVHASDIRSREEQQLRDVREAGSKMSLFPLDTDILDQIARMASHTLQMASLSWQQITAAHVAALHVASRNSVASSPVHSPASMGYTANSFFSRDLTALGALREPKSLIQVIAYDFFVGASKLLFGGHHESITLGTSACLCGVHLNIPRNLALYFDSSTPQGRLTLEPVITEGGRLGSAYGGAPLVTVQGLPWANQISDEKHGVSAAYLRLDEELRKLVGLEGSTGFPATNRISVDSMRLGRVSSGRLENHSQRTLRTIEGSEALCIQYCQHLAYGLRIKAALVPPSECNMTRNGGTAEF